MLESLVDFGRCLKLIVAYLSSLRNWRGRSSPADHSIQLAALGHALRYEVFQIITGSTVSSTFARVAICCISTDAPI